MNPQSSLSEQCAGWCSNPSFRTARCSIWPSSVLSVGTLVQTHALCFSLGLLNVKIADGKCTRYASYTTRSFGHLGELSDSTSFFFFFVPVIFIFFPDLNKHFPSVFQIYLWQLFEEERKNTEGKQVLCKKLVLLFLPERIQIVPVVIFTHWLINLLNCCCWNTCVYTSILDPVFTAMFCVSWSLQWGPSCFCCPWWTYQTFMAHCTGRREL